MLNPESYVSSFSSRVNVTLLLQSGMPTSVTWRIAYITNGSSSTLPEKPHHCDWRLDWAVYIVAVITAYESFLRNLFRLITLTTLTHYKQRQFLHHKQQECEVNDKRYRRGRLEQ
jgi:hypothetical protein